MSPPAGLISATAHETRSNGLVVKVEKCAISGTIEAAVAVPASSVASRAMDTSFFEREVGTDRKRDALKARRSYCFSKD